MQRYLAPDMRQALLRVRNTLGPHAVILSSRRVSQGVEVTAAVDFEVEERLGPTVAPPAAVQAAESADEPALADFGEQHGDLGLEVRRLREFYRREKHSEQEEVENWKKTLNELDSFELQHMLHQPANQDQMKAILLLLSVLGAYKKGKVLGLASVLIAYIAGLSVLVALWTSVLLLVAAMVTGYLATGRRLI